jgi:hypothetical protein
LKFSPNFERNFTIANGSTILNADLLYPCIHQLAPKEKDMNILRITIAAFLLVVSTQVLASQCPGDVKAVDAALTTTSIPAEVKAAVTDLRNAGETLHKAGKHKESVNALAVAKSLLGI